MDAAAGVNGAATPANPFGDEAAVRNSNYCTPSGSGLVRADGEPPSRLTLFVHTSVSAH